MRRAVHWAVVVVVIILGLIHLLGAAKGLGWADISQLKEPLNPGMAAAWLIAGALVVAAGVLLAEGVRWWWVIGAVAAIASQVVITTSWSDAKAGSVANIVLLAAVIYGFASQGPTSYRGQYRKLVHAALAPPLPADDVTEADLTDLPQAVAAYVRRSGAVGKPRVVNLRARIHGRIRAKGNSPWMTFTGEQVNTYGHRPRRLFTMDATLSGLPVDILHIYIGPSATMRVKACSLVPMVNMAGPDMDRSETVTLLNDLCLLAPAALIAAPISWQPIDTDHVRATYTNGAQTVTAELAFNSKHDLVDFVSDDRSRASPDGKSSDRQRWSTPVCNYRSFDSRRLCTSGEGRWHAPAPEGQFTYIEFHVDDITYNTSNASKHGQRSAALA